MPTSGSVATDTLVLRARYSAREVWLNARGSTVYDRRIPIFASLGWTMMLPFQWFIDGTPIEFLVSAIWIACLLLPIGYWGIVVFRYLPAQDSTRILIIALPIGLVLLYVGLLVVPQAFGVSAAAPRDWLAALTGIISGAVLAPRTIFTS
jgi:hypothetical protein